MVGCMLGCAHCIPVKGLLQVLVCNICCFSTNNGGLLRILHMVLLCGLGFAESMMLFLHYVADHAYASVFQHLQMS